MRNITYSSLNAPARRLLGKSLAFLFASIIISMSAQNATGQVRAAKLRFAVVAFQHETCTFCPGGDTTVEDWTAYAPTRRGDELLSINAYVRGFVSAARGYDEVELIGLESPLRVLDGSSRSWNTKETFDHFVSKMLSDLTVAGPVDGIYLALHGAMAVRGIPRPEAEIAKRFREIVGPDIPIVASFDLHANEDAEFLRYADMAFVTKRYPHYDSRLQGERAGHALVRLAKGTYRPTVSTRKPGIITPTVVQWTGRGASMMIMERARRWEAREPDAVVSVSYGFPWTDVPDVGAFVQVMTNNDQALADRIADDMDEYFWHLRKEFVESEEIPQPSQAVSLAKSAIANGQTPIALADYSDRSGDATWILKEIVGQDLTHTVYATLRDEHVLARIAAENLSFGTAFDMNVGGFAGPASGPPVRISGKIKYFGKGLGYDRIAIVSFGKGNALIITPALHQVRYPEEVNIGPISLDNFDAFVIKSRVHFRRGFDETGFAPTIYIVDAPGPFVGTRRLEELPYKNVNLGEHYPYGAAVPRQNQDNK